MHTKIEVEHFDFTAKVFRIQDAYFAHGKRSQSVAFYLSLGGISTSMPLKLLRTEFKIKPDSDDAKLLLKVEQALHHVSEVHHGDTIPREIIDGSASWKFEPQHQMIARGRVWFGLLSWAGHTDGNGPSASILVSYADNPGIVDQKVEALSRLVAAVDGFDQDEDRARLILEAHAREYAYIEALYEHYRRIFVLQSRFSRAREKHNSSSTGFAEFERVLALCQEPFRQASASFRLARALIMDPQNLISHPEQKITETRALRDGLCWEEKKWQPIMKAWEDEPASEHERVSRRHETYRFLARSWARGTCWS